MATPPRSLCHGDVAPSGDFRTRSALAAEPSVVVGEAAAGGDGHLVAIPAPVAAPAVAAQHAVADPDVGAAPRVAPCRDVGGAARAAAAQPAVVVHHRPVAATHVQGGVAPAAVVLPAGGLQQ